MVPPTEALERELDSAGNAAQRNRMRKAVRTERCGRLYCMGKVTCPVLSWRRGTGGKRKTQQRDKISPAYFPEILRCFNCRYPGKIKYEGYRLLACDGSDINIFRNPSDPSSYYRNSSNDKGFNELHIAALYDLCNRSYQKLHIVCQSVSTETGVATKNTDYRAGNTKDTAKACYVCRSRRISKAIEDL